MDFLVGAGFRQFFGAVFILLLLGAASSCQDSRCSRANCEAATDQCHLTFWSVGRLCAADADWPSPESEVAACLESCQANDLGPWLDCLGSAARDAGVCSNSAVQECVLSTSPDFVPDVDCASRCDTAHTDCENACTDGGVSCSACVTDCFHQATSCASGCFRFPY